MNWKAIVDSKDIYVVLDYIVRQNQVLEDRLNKIMHMMAEDEFEQDVARESTVTIDDDYTHLEVNVPSSPPELVHHDLSTKFCNDCWTRPCVCQELAAQRAKLRPIRFNQ